MGDSLLASSVEDDFRFMAIARAGAVFGYPGMGEAVGHSGCRGNEFLATSQFCPAHAEVGHKARVLYAGLLAPCRAHMLGVDGLH